MKVYAGQFEKIYDPGVGEEIPWYINDHCFIRKDGQWHLFGITHQEPAAPEDEKKFAHAVADRLLGSWTKQPYALKADESAGETLLWAPFATKHGETYYLYYCGGGATGDTYRLQLATSPDLYTFTRYEKNPVIVDGFHARDPMVLRLGDKWLLYYTATTQPKEGNFCICCAQSSDLRHWSGRRVVFCDKQRGSVGGPCESPFVLPYKNRYLLFCGPRRGYRETDVFVSDTPYDFREENKVGSVNAHAAEVVEEDGQLYISHCGWGQGGVYLAPLYVQD